LNSSDKSRRLSFNVGLYSENASCYVIGSTNTSLIKKHLKGVTKATEDATDKMERPLTNKLNLWTLL
jgi:hypothetical protein